MQSRYYTDSLGIVRLRGSNRKRRSDYGTKKPHPAHCAHCESVEVYRVMRESQLASLGGFRNETARAITFKEWLIYTAKENRYRAEMDRAAA